MATHIVNGGPVLSALFGNGTQTGGMVSQVHIGGSTYTNASGVQHQNPYANMRAILDALGVKPNSNVADHHNHFHIYLAPPTPVNITASLLAETAADAPQTNGAADILTAAQVLLAQIQTDTQEETLMFIMDVPNIPAQEPPLILADASATQSSAQKYDRVIGVCHLSANPYVPLSAENVLSPPLAVKSYYRTEEHYKIEGQASVSVLQMPTHGSLVDGGDGDYVYYPEKGYLGNDRATLLVEVGGKKIRMEYFFRVMTSVFESPDEDNYAEFCPEKVRVWKISSLTDTNGNKYISAVAYQSPTASADGASATDAGSATMDTAALTATLGSDFLDSLATSTPGVTLNIADLEGGAIGQAVGNTITLDDNAAGHNWFIDTTPSDNSEYLPTSNPYEWVAKEGTAAYGKMDMLSVLLHEYGHALGIDHSADNHDYMATTLTPGVRRMPSAEELALMQQLVAQAKDGLASNNTPDNAPAPFPTLPFGTTLSLAFLGRLRNTRYGGLNIEGVLPYAPTTQYAVAANATFANLNTPAGWNTQGSADIAPSTGSGGTASATLSEVSTSQTRLSQVFMLNEQDRYLSFTLSGAALDDLNGAPDDAFEVALLDANTGLSVLGSNGLTRTDSFLNIQGDGTQHAASAVTRIDNSDGSRTYRVDLTGVAKNTAVNLSFDLLGFGQDNSHLTLSDIRVSGLPQLQDEAAILAEDNLLTFDPFAQADTQLKPLLASHIVDAPTHGVLAVNADGTFSYTPEANYFGADSFSYRLSDGPLDSNLATVSLTVTAVNDAPVAADVALTTAEDTALVIAVGAYASDVDSTSLTTQIATGPAHGVLMQNADGSYSYTPDANYNGADSFTYNVNDGELDSNIATVTLAISAVNDAPVAVDTQAATDEDTPVNLNLLAAASDVDGDVLTPIIIAGPQHGQLLNNADGTFSYVSDLNYFGTDSFTYQVNDAQSSVLNPQSSGIATVTLTIAAVNDAPIAVSATVTGTEDTPYIFTWSDFRVSDVDSDDLAITINTLPAYGLLQYYDGLEWTAVAAGRRIGKAEIDAGMLCFGPDVNESGFAGYGVDGTGNRLNNYASFTYHADDGLVGAYGNTPTNQSAIATMTINITPVADAPSLVLSAATDAYGATALRFSTGWEIAPNRNPTFTILPQITSDLAADVGQPSRMASSSISSLDGWNVVRETGDTSIGSECQRNDEHRLLKPST